MRKGLSVYAGLFFFFGCVLTDAESICYNLVIARKIKEVK